MKTVLFFKQVDFWLQVSCIAIPATGLLVSPNDAETYVPLAYGSELCCQLLSWVLNSIFLDKFLRAGGRSACSQAFAIILILFAICWLTVYPLLLFLYAMLVAGPIVAAWYAVISYQEVAIIKRQVDRKQFA